jgi:hypothetical protein
LFLALTSPSNAPAEGTQVPHVFRSRAEEREAWQVRVASNQSRFREVNERLEELNREFSEIIPTGDFVCECADTDCLERVGLTIEEYEQLRSVPTHFARPPRAHRRRG